MLRSIPGDDSGLLEELVLVVDKEFIREKEFIQEKEVIPSNGSIRQNSRSRVWV